MLRRTRRHAYPDDPATLEAARPTDLVTLETTRLEDLATLEAARLTNPTTLEAMRLDGLTALEATQNRPDRDARDAGRRRTPYRDAPIESTFRSRCARGDTYTDRVAVRRMDARLLQAAACLTTGELSSVALGDARPKTGELGSAALAAVICTSPASRRPHEAQGGGQ